MNKKRQIAAAAFKAADTNGDGKLDLDEYMGHLKKQGVNASQEDARILFTDHDRDLDNFISFQEFSGQTTQAERAWRALDAKKNGCLTRQDLQNGMRKYKKTLPSSITSLSFMQR